MRIRILLIARGNLFDPILYGVMIKCLSALPSGISELLYTQTQIILELA
jgi:hypothetical protein